MENKTKKYKLVLQKEWSNTWQDERLYFYCNDELIESFSTREIEQAQNLFNVYDPTRPKLIIAEREVIDGN